jgi:hypothetical protein
MAPSPTRRSRIRSVLISIIPVEFIITIQWWNGRQFAWLAPPAAVRLNLCTEILATIPTEMLTGVINIALSGFMRIGEIELIPEGTGVVPPPICHLGTGYVKLLSHQSAEGWPQVAKRRTPACAVRPQQLELETVVSHDWIQKDIIIKVVPGSLILDAANFEYPYEPTDVFRDEFLYMVLIQPQALIYNRHRQFGPSGCLPLTFLAAYWCHCCEKKLNLHPTQ